jgi:hypothetical protein
MHVVIFARLIVDPSVKVEGDPSFDSHYCL